MPVVSITEAAGLAGVSRGTLYNRLREGVLSRSEGGIELSELMRVFGPLVPLRTSLAPAAVADVTAHDPVTAGSTGGDLDGKPQDVTRQGERDDAVAILARRLEAADEQARWLRELLERRERMAVESLAEKDRELADVRARLDEREAFWAGQVARVARLPSPESISPRGGFWRRLLG